MDEATLPGQLYALAGLYLIDPDHVRSVAAGYQSSSQEIDCMSGCIMYKCKVSDVMESILSGEASRALAGY